MFFGIQEVDAHATQVGYCVLNNGLVRVYIEHWHGDLSQSSLTGSNSVNLTIISSGGSTNFPSLLPTGFVNNSTVNNLPGCGPNINIVSSCPGYANTYNDWVYYDFPPISCGEQITIRIDAGNSVLLTEACSQLYPATINATFYDQGGPVLTCPDVNVTGCSPTVVNYSPPGIVDDCDPNPVITNYSHPSGSTFQPGTTQVTVSAIDNLSQVGTCNFNVNVNPPPGGCCPATLQLSSVPTSPTCPGGNDGSINLSVGAGTAPFSYMWSNGATTQDISGLTGGQYTVNVSDANGCTDMLTVNLPDGVDNVLPTAICQSGSVVLDGSGNGSISASQINNGSYDNCGGVSLFIDNSSSIEQNYYNTNNYSSGHGQSFTATETGFLTSVSFKVYGTSYNRKVHFYNGNGSGIPGSIGTPLYTEENVTLTDSYYGYYWTTVTLSTPLPVVGGQKYAFVIEGYTDILYTNDYYSGGEFIWYYDTSSGCCTWGDIAFKATFGSTTKSFDCSNLGSNSVTLVAVDGSGNQGSCSTTVTVSDNNAPVPNFASLPTVTAECGTDVSAPTATDNCAGQVTGTTNDQTTFSEQGTYTINWTYNDGNGNSSGQSQTVVIDDVTPPDITCPQNITSGTDAGACGASVPFNVQASDNCSFTYVCTIGGDEGEPSECYGNTVNLTINLDDFPTETTWMLMDGNGITIENGGPYFTPGGTITETFTLADGDYMFMIKDAFGDGICCLFGEGSYSLTSNGEEIASGGAYGEGEKTNFCVEAPSAGGGLPLTEIQSGHFFPVGTTTVTCTVTDAGGNTDVCTFDVTVNDTEAPMIATPCPGTITRCGAQPVSWTPPTATDNCAVISTVSNYNPGDFFEVGTHTVMYTFSDAAGLSVSCSFDVVINPLPEVEIVQDDLPTWCQGIKVLTAEVLNPEALTFPLTYNWSNGLGNASQVIAPANGTYFVTVTDALGCFTVESTTIDVDISTLLSAYTIISGEEFEMYLSDVIGGGVGIEDADEAEIALNSNIFTFLRADAANVQVDGSSFINNFIDADFNIPFPAFQSNPFNDNNHVNVPGNSTMTLSGSNYGNVYVGFGATLIIDNADIHLRSLITAKDATIIFNQPTEMKIRRKMYIGETNTVNPDGHTIVIYVSDQASVGQGSNVTANIYAPEGLDVNDSGSSLTTYMTGMFISNDRVSSDHNVVWNWNLNCSYLPDTQQPPVIDYSEQIEVNTPESSIAEKGDFNVYPNPTAGLLNIDVTSFLDEAMEIEMFNALGEIVWRQKVDRLETTLITANMTNLADGVYFLQITSNGKRLSKQIILNK